MKSLFLRFWIMLAFIASVSMANASDRLEDFYGKWFWKGSYENGAVMRAYFEFSGNTFSQTTVCTFGGLFTPRLTATVSSPVTYNETGQAQVEDRREEKVIRRGDETFNCTASIRRTKNPIYVDHRIVGNYMYFYDKDGRPSLDSLGRPMVLKRIR